MKLTIKPDDKYAQAFLKAVEKKYKEEERPDDGKWHAGQLAFPRHAFAEKVYGRRSNPKKTGFFFLGKAVHSEVQRIMGIPAEVKAEKMGVVGTMDMKGKESYEIKSSRKWTVPDWPEPHYVKQSGEYAVIHDLSKVIILMILPTAGRTWNGKKASTVEAASWTIAFKPDVKKAIQYDMQRTIEELEHAIQHKDEGSLPPSPDWILEDYPEVDPGKYDRKEDEAHPFYFAWHDKGWL